MSTDPFRCDPARLKSLLAQELAGSDESEVLQHLDTCMGCQKTIERLAAESALWNDARRIVDLDDERADAKFLRHGPDLANPVESVLDFLAPADAPGLLGRLGGYEVTKVLGRGGMGVVLQARDPALERAVAIKVLAPELATSGNARRRFAREAQATAAIAHEHVVAIHAVEASATLPYLVMQLVPGKSLQDRIDLSGPLETKEIVRIAMQTASGLAAAHAQGLIHRDIKPANILLENGVERVKITDFGLARALDDASLTQSGVIAGTPQYMAPEQARGDAVDPRADLFSLGSVMYAMATGHSPFRAPSTMAVLRRVTDDQPRPVRELNPEIPDWLAAIVAKLLAKDPAARYQSAAEVAELLGRHLAHLQQHGSTPPPFAVLPRARTGGRWVVAAAALLIVTIGLGASEATGVTKVGELVATVFRIRTADGTLVVECGDPEVEISIDGKDVVIKGAGPHEVRLRPGLHELRAARPGGQESNQLITISRGDRQVVKVTFEALASSPSPVLESSKGREEAGLSKRLERAEAELANLKRRLSADEHARVGRATTQAIGSAEADLIEQLSAAERKMAQVQRIARSPANPTVRHFQKRIDELRAELALVDASARGARAPSADLPRDAFAAEGDVPGRPRSGDAASDQRARPVPPEENLSRPQESASGEVTPYATLRHSEKRLVKTRFLTLAFSPDRETLATGSELYGPNSPSGAGELFVWKLSISRPVAHGPVTGPPSRVLFSPDGMIVAASVNNGPVSLMLASTLRHLGTIPVQNFGEGGMAFSPNGGELATAGRDGIVRLWDVETSKERASVKMSDREIRSVAFSPDGRRLVVGGQDPVVRIWDTSTSTICLALQGHRGFVRVVQVSPGGKTIATVGSDKTVRLWDDHGHAKGILEGHRGDVFGLAFSPDGSLLATCGGHQDLPATGELKLWDLTRLTGWTVPNAHAAPVHAVAFSPDGRTLASGSADGTVKLWDVATLKAASERRRPPATSGQPAIEQAPGALTGQSTIEQAPSALPRGPDTETTPENPALERR